MDLVVKGRGSRVSKGARELVARKVDRLVRHDPRVQRVEIVLIEEPNPRVDGGHRVEASVRSRRRTFHASAAGSNVETIVDRVVDKLERQLSDHAGKRRAKLIDGANRVKSAMIQPGSENPSPDEGDAVGRG